MQPLLVVIYKDHEENLRSEVIDLNFDIHEFRNYGKIPLFSIILNQSMKMGHFMYQIIVFLNPILNIFLNLRVLNVFDLQRSKFRITKHVRDQILGVFTAH